MMRVVKITAAFILLLAGLLLGGRAAFGDESRGGGESSGNTFQVWGTPGNGPSSGGTIVLTGAIGDSGTAGPANANGQPDPNGNFRLLALQKGTILVNNTELNEDSNNPNRPPTTFNKKTCSATFVITDPSPIVSGTGAYAGIHGSATITLSFALVFALTNGTCSMNSNAAPLAQYGSIAGSGTVSFQD
jgi:hypothetical protein